MDDGGNDAMIDAAKMVHQILCARHSDHFSPREYDSLVEQPEEPEDATNKMAFLVHIMLRMISTISRQASAAQDLMMDFKSATTDEARAEIWKNFSHATKLESHIHSIDMTSSHEEWVKSSLGSPAKVAED